MPLPAPNRFQSYILTPDETVLGSTFNELQLCVIRNELANAANEKLNMKFSASDKEILQEEAELQGKMNAFQWLLDMHDASQKEHLRLQLTAAEMQNDE